MIQEVQLSPKRSRAKATTQIKLDGLPAIQGVEAEKALLSAMLSEPEMVIDLALESQLQPEDFFHPAHQEIFRALVGMRNQSIPVDPSTLLQYLTDRKLLESIGGATWIGDLAAAVVSTLTAGAHIKTVRTKSILRRLQQACAQIVYNAHDRQHQAEDVLDEAESLIFEITDKAVSQSIASSKQVVYQTLQMIENMSRRKNLYSGIPSGFYELDKLTGGFKPGEMIVIAARPGIGKTALALSMAKHFVKERYDEKTDQMVRPGYAVGFFSLEMTAQQLMLRLLAATSNKSLQMIREGKLTESDLRALQSIGDELASLPLYMDESSMLSISQLRAKTRRMRQLYKIDILIIDYLQLLTSSSSKAQENRQVEVAEISRGIKALALELKIPIIVLAQLNRRPEEANTEPALHHLRESGSIEQDADLVLLLSRAEKDAAQASHAEGGKAEESGGPQSSSIIRAVLNIAKQRNGPVDKLELLFHRSQARFESAPRMAK